MFGNCCCSGPCDGACVIHSDKFDRADSGTIGTGWTEDAGAWEIKNNTLYTEDSNAKASYAPDPFDLTTDGSVLVAKFRGEDSGDEIIVWYGTGFYVVLTIGTPGTLQVYDSTNLLLYECAVNMAAAQWHILKIVGSTCSPEGYFTKFTVDEVDIITVQLVLNPIDELACATGAITTSAAFDFVCINSSEYESAGCPGGISRPWILDESVTQLTIVIAGAIDNGTIDYTPLNGTYVVPFDDAYGGVLSIPPVTLGADTVDRIAFEVYGGGFFSGNTWWEIGCGFLDDVTNGYDVVYLQAFGNDAAPPVGSGTTPIQDGVCGDTVDLPGFTNADIGDATMSY